MKLYVVRHGQTDWNRAGKLQGQVEVPLNETGVAQAYQTKAQLADTQLDLILCSPLGRARQTAEIINEGRELEIICDKRLVERSFGEYEGGSSKDLNWVDCWSYEKNIRYREAENIRDFYDRVFAWLEELPERYSDKRVLVVTHAGPMRALAYYFSGRTLTAEEVARATAKNTEIREYEWTR